MTTAEAVREVRRVAKLSQRALGALIWDDSNNDKQSAVSDIERGARKDLQVEEMQRIERGCGVAPGTILRLTGYLAIEASTEAAVLADPRISADTKSVILRMIR